MTESLRVKPAVQMSVFKAELDVISTEGNKKKIKTWNNKIKELTMFDGDDFYTITKE